MIGQERLNHLSLIGSMNLNSKIRVVIHIGAPKCGSSSIQSVLNKNQRFLYDNKVAVIDSSFKWRKYNHQCRAGPSWYFQGVLDGKSDKDNISKTLNDAITGAQEAGMRFCILSAENLFCLYRPNGAQTLRDSFSAVIRDHDVHVIAYVRRQDEVAEATWKQWMCKEYDQDISEWLDFFAENKSVDYYKELMFWDGLLSPRRNNVRANILHKDFLYKGDLWRDFCRLAELPSALEKLADGRKVNQSAPAHWIQWATQHKRTLFSSQHDNRLYEFFATILRHLDNSEYKRQTLIKEDKRLLIADAFKHSNHMLCERFLKNKEKSTEYFSRSKHGRQVVTDAGTAFEEISVLYYMAITEKLDVVYENANRECDTLRQECNILREERDTLRQERDILQQQINEILQSKSWLLTSPIRYLATTIRRVSVFFRARNTSR